MSPVLVEYRKWPDLGHWRYETVRLGRDRHGIWLGADLEAYVAKGDDPPITVEHPFIQLIGPGRWWTAIWNHGGRMAVYVDVITPPTWEGDRVWMIDLDLDVVRWRDGRIEVLDEDEFLESAHLYPERVAQRARATAATVALALGRGEEPFGRDGRRWLERFVRSGTVT